MYGSSRLGMNTNKVDMLDEDPEEIISLSLGNKLYEMSNHLGNVLTLINDIKVPQATNSVDVDGYLATIVSTADYSPFGVQLDERTVSSESYRYGYQGSEKDDEVKGSGNSYTTEFRLLDPRLGRWLSIDPLAAEFPWQSPYVSMDNNPIALNDILGLSADGEPNEDEGTKKWDNLKPITINPINGAGTYQTENGRFIYQDECGQQMLLTNPCEALPDNEATYQECRLAQRTGTASMSTTEFAWAYERFNWARFDYNVYKLSKEEQYYMLHPDRSEIDKLQMICAYSIGVPLLGAFGGLFIMEGAAPSLVAGTAHVVEASALYHSTIGMNGGYLYALTDFGMQTVRNGGVNGDMNFFSLGTSAFVPFGSSWGKHLFQIGSSTYVDVSWNSGIMFGAGNYDHASNFSNIFIDAYGRSKYGTPLLGIYWNLMIQGSIGNLERGNNADGTPRQ